MENGAGTLPGHHAKEGKLPKVEGSAGREAACEKVDESSRGSRVEAKDTLKSYLVVVVEHLKLLLVED